MMKVWLALGLLISAALGGCASRSDLQSRERAAFLAGEDQAQARQNPGPAVTVVGPVKFHVVAWTPDLTVARAIIEAEYFPKTDPRSLWIIRNGTRIPIDPKDLLAGKDFPLRSGDVLEIQP